ncbi:hypothetical protein [Bacillus sp. 1P06AnD]|uniref:hypothetical protein n=1 Tax=Bacillus sp. 1P06AnD TaxID=3132208 RepID=UPI0039A007F6
MEGKFIKRITSNAVQYWKQPFVGIKHDYIELAPSAKIVYTALLSAFTAVLQSTGGFLPGIGFLVSAMATLPIFLATIISVRYGCLAYVVTLLLLLFIQPSELIIFPFTTGVLGLALGVSFFKSKTRFLVVLWTGASLFGGILAVLYIFHLPLLGPAVGTSFHFIPLVLIAIFCILYAWIAAEACSYILKRLAYIMPDRVIKSNSGEQEVNLLEKDSVKKDNIESGR